jgi:putative transposase
VKSAFSGGIARGERLSERRQIKGERGIWQRRFWEHAIRDERDFEKHVDYIHYNPVMHGHAQTVAEWPHSSFHRFVAAGIYSADWAAGDEVKKLEFE